MRPFFLSLFLQARRNATTQGGAPLPYTKRPPSFRMTICSLYVARSRVLTPLLAARTRSLAAAQGGGRRRGNTAGAEQDRSIYIASFSRPAFGSSNMRCKAASSRSQHVNDLYCFFFSGSPRQT